MTWRSGGHGLIRAEELAGLGEGTVIEPGVLVFHPGHVHIGAHVYIGHRTMLRGDPRGEFRIGDGSWIGQNCFFQSAGGIQIGRRAGIGPGVMIITSTHTETQPPAHIMDAPLEFAPVFVGDGADIGIGALLLPGAHIGVGAQVGAGAVVTGEIPDGAVAAGVPARVVRFRKSSRARDVGGKTRS